jgi:hypothetical protein
LRAGEAEAGADHALDDKSVVAANPQTALHHVLPLGQEYQFNVAFDAWFLVDQGVSVYWADSN